MSTNHKYIVAFFLFIIAAVFPSCGSDDDPDTTPVPPPAFERVQESLEMKSNILLRPMLYSVLLPEGYDKTDETYPVVYLLHGYGDSETSWLGGGQIKSYTDRAVSKGLMPKAIYIMPQGFNTYYVNKFNGNYPYMDMFVKELVPYIDANYRTKEDKNLRAVVGYSMGGYGSFILPSVNPDVFGVSVSLSMSWRTDEQYMAEPQGVFDSQFGSIFGGVGQSGTGRLTDYFKQMSPFHFFTQTDLNKYKQVRYYLDCGDDEEQLSITNDALHTLMRDRQVQHEFRMRNGGHDWNYWNSGMEDALSFIGSAFAGREIPDEANEVSVHPETLKGKIAIVSVNNADINVYLPQGYNNSDMSYPVIYFLHDRLGKNENDSFHSLVSLFEDAFDVSLLNKCIIAEIPFSEGINGNFLDDVIAYVDDSYRAIAKKTARILMINNGAGKCSPDSFGKVNGCFLFNTDFDYITFPKDAGFYYLDITDNSRYYANYGKLYSVLREMQIPHQYRIRQGTDSYRSFLAGINQSFPYMKEHLDKPSK